jgi:hypothetical protein
VVSQADRHARAVFVHSEPPEQTQDEAAIARRIDDAPALLRHQVPCLEQSVSEMPAVHGPCVPIGPCAEPVPGSQESGQAGGGGMSPQPTPSSSSRTAPQSSAEK